MKGSSGYLAPKLRPLVCHSTNIYEYLPWAPRSSLLSTENTIDGQDRLGGRPRGFHVCILPTLPIFCTGLSIKRLVPAIVLITPQSLALCIKDRANEHNLYKRNGKKPHRHPRNVFCKVID